MKIYYSANIFIVVVAMAIMSVSVKYNLSIDKKQKRAMVMLFLSIIAAALCEWGGVMLDGVSTDYIIWHTIIKTLELSISPFIAVLCSYSIADHDHKKITTYVMLANVVLEIISAFTGFIFYVDSSNYYHHGTCYWIYSVFLALGILLFLYSGITATRKYQYTGGIIIFLILIFIVAGLTVQLFFSSIKIDWIVMAVASIMLYKFYGDMLSQSDGLTGLLNRLGYENYILKQNGKGAIIIFDVDDFKDINDTFGHANGDYYLREVSDIIRKIYKPYGMTFRIGGDEFCVVVRKDVGKMEECGRKLQEIIMQRIEQDANFPNISFGYADFDTSKEDIAEAFDKADAAMYNCKSSRKAK